MKRRKQDEGQGQFQDAALGLLCCVAADFHIFHYPGKFLVRFLGTELDLVASGHQTGLRGMKLHGACCYNQVFPRRWDALAERV
eukprot:bmy_16026T0